MNQEYDAIVIGAGISGLAATIDLLESKINTTVVEKEAWVGGRASSLRLDGFILERGAMYIFAENVLRKYYKKAGIRDEEIVKVSKKISFYYDGRVHELDFSSRFSFLRSLMKFKMIKPRQKFNLKLFSFLKECTATFKKVKADYENFRIYNDRDAYHLLLKYFDGKAIENIFQPISESFLFARLENVSASIFIVLLGSLLESSNNMYHVKDGIGYLAEKFSEKVVSLGGRIVHTEAVKIEKKDDMFHVHCSDNTRLISKAVISSIPVANLKQIIPQHKDMLEQEYKWARYVPAINVNIGLKEPLTELGDNHICFLRPNWSSPIVFIGECTGKNANVAPRGKGLLYTLLSPEFSEKYMDLPEDKIFDIIDAELSRIFPDYKTKKMFSKIFKWEHAFALTSREYFHNSETKTRIGGLFLCGDCIYVGLDGVAESGEKAAIEALSYISEYIKTKETKDV